MDVAIWIIVVIFALALGAAGGYFFNKYQTQQINQRLQIEADHILTEAQEKARMVELEARDEAIKIRQAAEKEAARQRTEFARQDNRLQRRRDQMDRRAEKLERREQALNKRQSVISKQANEIEKVHAREMAELQRIPNTLVELKDDEFVKVMKLIDALEDDDDVQKVFHNMDVSDKQMELV
jgi:ribonuclease Y